MAGLIWFKQDLRLFDNQAVSQAWKNHDTLHAVIFETEQTWKEHDWAPIKRDLYERRVNALGEELAELGVVLEVISVKEYAECAGKLVKICKQQNIEAVYFNREMPVHEKQRDKAVASWCQQHNISTHIFDNVIAVAPEKVKTGQGTYFKKFTPFYRAWKKVLAESLPESPSSLSAKAKPLSFQKISLKGKKNSSNSWSTDTKDILKEVDAFIHDVVNHYHTGRDAPSERSTSLFSPWFEIGAIGVNTVIRKLMESSPNFPDGLNQGQETWLSELAWRDFYQHLMWHVPRLSYGKAFIQETDAFNWENDEKKFAAWCSGNTGYPIVDAGMRQLNETGWMHNRLRMITASFLVKDLLIDWRWGEKYFMQNLIDGSFPANNGGWQWSASTGTDAVPYFRVFNPERQSERFDPNGDFIRSWIKELKDVPKKYIHRPEEYLKNKQSDYPRPIVDHKTQREKFLTQFKSIKNG